MNISSLSIQRPVLATVFSLLILLFGGIGFYFLGVREYPSVDPPVITVATSYVGANSDVIESQITEPLEESINGIAGISSLSSTSSEGMSSITVEFELGIDLEAAANDVRDRVSRAVRNLPPDCNPPIVTKSDADASPIFTITLQSDSRNLLDLTEYANNVFKERLQTIPGVSEIGIWGEQKYAIKILIDPARLASYQLTPADIKNALDKENIELPSGRIEGNNTELTIRTFGRLQTPAEFNEMVITERDGQVIKVKDIGNTVFAPENERTILKGNGKVPMVGVAITPQPGSNYISIVDEAYKRLELIRKDLPADIRAGIAMDRTKSIRKSITEVEETLLIAFILVVLVIFLFLRNWRTTLIPVIAIPVSLIGAFFIMYISGFSINVLTLLAVVLATGLVVDDAIVVLENIYHKIESGVPPIQAGHEGSHEIMFAIISTTITLAAVFLPIIFISGMTGRLFREFGIVVAGSVLISAFISLTLTPMMSARFLRKNPNQSKIFMTTERFFENMISGYGRQLTTFMKHRLIAVVIMIVSGLMIFLVGRTLQSELAPLEDKSFVRVSATAPEGTSYDVMLKFMDKLVDVVDTLPEKDALVAMTAPGFSNAAVNTGSMRISLLDPELRKKSQQQITDDLNAVFRKFSFARTYVTQEQTIGGGRNSGMPVQFVIQAPSFEKLKEVLPKFLDKVQNDPTFQMYDVNLKFNKPELAVSINREKAATMGVSVKDIIESLQLYFSGQRYGFFIRNSKQYQVIGQANRQNRSQPMDLKSIYVRNKNGELVQLDNLVSLSEQSNPPQLYRFNRYISATVSAAPATGKTLGQGIQAMQKIASSTLEEGFVTSLTGPSKDFAQSSNSLLFALYLALILIYLILSAQFESFVDPLIIMLTVPLAIAGAVLSLGLFHQTLNIFSEIGIIILIGIVTKNGILIVEFANQRKAAGMNVKDAVIDAATRRLRPILMTSLATALGALPIALSIGAASKSRIPMGITIIGGLIFSLILTLFVIPALYTFLTKKPRPVNDESILAKG